MNQLGITIDATDTYELQSFDRQISTAQAVRLELLFLNRRFRGKFLIVEQETGILGRDILNYIAIVLDGPELNWRELV